MKLTTLKKEMTKVIKLVRKNTDVDNLSNQEIDGVLGLFQLLDREDIIAILEGSQITIGGDVKVELKRQYK